MTHKRGSSVGLGEGVDGGRSKMSLACVFLLVVSWNAATTQGIQIDNQLVSSPNGKKSIRWKLLWGLYANEKGTADLTACKTLCSASQKLLRDQWQDTPFNGNFKVNCDQTQ